MNRNAVDMKMNTHNGFVLEYNGPIFPCTTSNAITYECFCFKGAIANGRLQAILRTNGTYTYFTYHDSSCF